MIVTNKAVDFTATAVLGNNEIVEDFNLYKNIGEKGAVVLSKRFYLRMPERDHRIRSQISRFQIQGHRSYRR